MADFNTNDDATANDSGTNGTNGSTGSTGSGNPELMDRVVKAAHDAIDRLAETAAPHVQRIAEGYDSASEALSERADAWRSTGDEWTESLRTTVRDNPFTAIAAALAFGLLVSRITR